MNMAKSNAKSVDFNGYFDIEYIPDDNLSRSYNSTIFPFDVKMVLGDQTLGLNGTEYQCGAYSFFPDEYLRNVSLILEGEESTINLDENCPAPVNFSPQGNRCLVQLVRDKVGKKVSFDKNKVKDQVVSLDEAVYKLAKAMNECLFDLDEKRVYSILDELEIKASPLISDPNTGVGEVLTRHGSTPYQFKTAESTQRVLNELRKKQKVHTYDVFLDSLSERQFYEWDNILECLRFVFPNKSDEELYQEAEFNQ